MELHKESIYYYNMLKRSRQMVTRYFSKIALLVLALGFHFVCTAQSKNQKIPLHYFLQEHFDSTIIYHQRALWEPADYFIIAKKDTQVYSFRYTRPYPVLGGRQYPSALINKFIMDNVKYDQVLPDTNQYFRTYEASLNSRREGWRSIIAFDIWNLQSNMNDTLKNCQIYDGAHDTYYLITKDQVKTLEYYAAEYFEECEGPSVDRRNEILTRKAVFEFFKYNYQKGY